MLRVTLARHAVGHFHHPQSSTYRALYQVQRQRKTRSARVDVISVMEPHRSAENMLMAPSSSSLETVVVKDELGSSSVGPSRFATLLARAAEKHTTLSIPQREVANVQGEDEIDAGRRERRWYANAPTVNRQGTQRGGIDIFGETTTARRHEEAQKAMRLKASLRLNDSSDTKKHEDDETFRAPTVATVTSRRVEVPLAPVMQLRRTSYLSPDGSGDVDQDGHTPRAVSDAARLAQHMQENALRQVQNKEWFRCRGCGTVVEAVPEKLLKSGNAHDPRGAKQVCAKCGKSNFQWLLDYAHRRAHTMPPPSREGHTEGAGGSRRTKPGKKGKRSFLSCM